MERPAMNGTQQVQRPKNRIPEAKMLKDMQVLRLRPGDVIVLRCDHSLSDKTLEYLIKLLKKQFPENKCMVLEEGLEIGVIEKHALSEVEGAKNSQ